MTPTQRAAALRLADSLEWLLRNCADPDSYPMSMSKEAATLLRELLATPVVNQQMTTDPAEPVQAPSPLAGTMAEQFLQVVAGIWHDHPDYSIRQTLDALNATFPAEPVAAELPAPQLLVESAQGFVEGWTRSQVRSAINLALLVGEGAYALKDAEADRDMLRDALAALVAEASATPDAVGKWHALEDARQALAQVGGPNVRAKQP